MTALAPAQQEPRPLELVPGLDDLAGRAGKRTPLRIEGLAQSATHGIDEIPEREAGDFIREHAPGRVIVDGEPGKARFEEMHVRVREERQATRQPGVESEVRPLEVPIYKSTEPGRLFDIIWTRPENTLAFGERQQRERLIVKDYPLIESRALRIRQREEESIRSAVLGEEEVESVRDRMGGIPFPAKRRGHGKGVCLARLHAGTTRLGERLAFHRQALVKSPAHEVHAMRRPQWIG